MSIELQSLIDKQHEDDLLILRTFEKVAKSGPVSKGKLTARLANLESRWNAMIARHAQIDELKKPDNAELDYFKENLFDVYEEHYIIEQAKFLDASDELEKKEVEAATTASRSVQATFDQ